jgi:P2-related tail formation protein
VPTAREPATLTPIERAIMQAVQRYTKIPVATLVLYESR